MDNEKSTVKRYQHIKENIQKALRVKESGSFLQYKEQLMGNHNPSLAQ